MDNKDLPVSLVEQFENLASQIERNRIDASRNTDRLIQAMSKIMSRLADHQVDARITIADHETRMGRLEQRE